MRSNPGAPGLGKRFISAPLDGVTYSRYVGVRMNRACAAKGQAEPAKEGLCPNQSENMSSLSALLS